MKIHGIDELGKTLSTIADNAKKLDGTHSVSLDDLLTPEFVAQNTRFANADALFNAGGFSTSSQEEFKAIPEDTLDAFVRAESPFDSWQDMLSAAGGEWAKRQLAFDARHAAYPLQ